MIIHANFLTFLKAIFLCLLLASCDSGDKSMKESKPISDSESGEQLSSDWPLYGRDYSNQRFSPLTQISTENISKLKLAWSYKTGKKATFQTSPIVIDGTMFITTPFNDVIALNAESGDEIWRYEHQLTKDEFCCGPANRGPAVANGIVYTATIDARLIALDQKSGKVLWDIEIEDSGANDNDREALDSLSGVEGFANAVQTGASGYSSSMAPQIYDGKVFIGITGAGYGLHMEVEEGGKQKLSVGGFSGGGHGQRGFLVAYDAKTGEEIWRWYSVPEQGWEGEWKETTANGVPLNRDIASEKSKFEKFKDSWRYGGGSIWTTPAIDTKLGLIYFGTGNPSPNMEDGSRPGDNLHACSLIALDIKTGELKWFYQQIPHDRWGYDVASPPVLFDLKIDGKTIRAVGQASKVGWLFIHDAETGELLRRSDPWVEQENLFAPPSEAGERVVPGTIGTTSWSPVAIMPDTNTAFILGVYQPSIFLSVKLEPQPDQPWDSYSYFKQTDEPDWGVFSALALDTGKILWQTKVDDPMVGGALATAGGLVFTGEGNGQFDAFDAKNGELLWQHKSEYGVNAPPVTYAINGKQYVAVAAGGNKVFGYKTGDEILVFALDN
ncbi:MAG: glucose dehydrogenase [Gammaproteobacteria bacterium]|jgi:glucose dehydrogenase